MQRPFVFGIAGGTGSGKTTVAQAIRDTLPKSVLLIDHDSYYKDLSHLSEQERAEVNFDHPDSLDNGLLSTHLAMLKRGEPVNKPVYDFRQHVRTDTTIPLDPAPVVLVEGILTLAIPELRAEFDVKVFVDTAADIRLMRRIRRDIERRGRTFESVRAQYYKTVRPMHVAFVEPSKAHADLIVPEGGQNTIAIDFLVARIRQYLQEAR
ncbi:MAG: uridine kinase [Deltaproteobacteria bacterium]|nr:uridine kinase [Deltaproteobacteria bacterium]